MGFRRPRGFPLGDEAATEKERVCMVVMRPGLIRASRAFSSMRWLYSAGIDNHLRKRHESFETLREIISKHIPYRGTVKFEKFSFKASPNKVVGRICRLEKSHRQDAPATVSMGKKSPHQLSFPVHRVSIIGHRSPSEAYTKHMNSVHHAACQAPPSLPLTFQPVFHGNLGLQKLFSFRAW